MHRVRQKIFFGGSILAGVGLSVLIGWANPPSPRELALKAAQAFGFVSDGSRCSEAARTASGGDSQPLEAANSGGEGSVGPSRASDSAPEPPVGPSSPTHPWRDSTTKPSPAGTASPEAGEGLRRKPALESQKTSLGELIAPVGPAYAHQVAVSSSPSEDSGQTASAGSGPPSAENPSAQPTEKELPLQLRELWRQMRAGRMPDPSPRTSSTETSPPASCAPHLANPGSSPSAAPIAEPSPSAQLIPEPNGRLIINIRNEDIRRVLEMFSEQGNLNILATSSVQGKVSASLTGVDLDSALQAILRSAGYVARREGKFIYVGTPEDFLRMEQAADRIGTRVYRPNYIKASDLKDLIQPLLTEKVGLVSVSAPAEIGIASDDDKVGGNSFAGAETVLVRDYETVLAQIDQVVAEIDVRPMQVHIEAMILSVRLDDTDKFGVDFKKLINNSNFTIGWGTPVDSLSKVTFTQGGLKFGFIDGDVGAFLEALESVADANVIAAPRLMVLNKHRADILIGRQEGYVNTTQTETATTQTVQFLDIGTQLRIRPFISPDGLIRMEIHPELSDGSVTVQGNFTLPQKDVTKVTTNIMVRDGCTVVIGGLMQEQATTSVNQIPFFGNLPLVGVLFRRKTEEVKRVEIIVLVTPRIVREPEAYGEAALQQCEFQRRQNVYLEKMSPLGKRSIARRYVRMAQHAWSEGDMDRALRFAEMAVHFDPLNREALELRAQIWQRISPAPLPEEALYPPAQGDWTKPLDGPTVAPWILQELEKPPGESPVPESPLPQLPSPPEGVNESPKNMEQPRTAPPSSPSGALSGRVEDSGSGHQKEPPLRRNPIRYQESRSKPIQRPSVLQTEPLRFP